MKKLLALVVSAMMLISLVACGGSSDNGLKKIKITGEKITYEEALLLSDGWTASADLDGYGWYELELFLKAETIAYQTQDNYDLLFGKEGEILSESSYDIVIKGLLYINQSGAEMSLTMEIDAENKALTELETYEESKVKMEAEMTMLNGECYVKTTTAVEQGGKKQESTVYTKSIDSFDDYIDVNEIKGILNYTDLIKNSNQMDFNKDGNSLFIHKLNEESLDGASGDNITKITVSDVGSLEKVSVYVESGYDTNGRGENLKARLNLKRVKTGSIELPSDIEKYQ